jgi:signal peptidase I
MYPEHHVMEKNKNTEEELVQQFDSNQKKFPLAMVLVVLVMAVLGIGSGFLIARVSGGSLEPTKQVTDKSQVTKGTSLG